MAAIHVCDGCGKPTPEPKQVGRVTLRDYCDACEPRAKAFMDAEEDLRKRLTDQFRSDRALLVAKASEGGFRLPDISDAG
jgi:hypothetical protein